MVNNEKMSKSLGNVINPEEILEKYGIDPFRYFFLRHVDTFADSDFTWEKFDSAYSSELANDLGNLVQRLSNLCEKNSVSLSSSSIDSAKSSALSDPEYSSYFSSYNFSGAFDYVWTKVQSLNKRIDEEKPWSLAKTSPSEAKSCLSSLASDLLSVSYLLTPFLPETSEKIQKIFTSSEISAPKTPLFPKY